MRLDFVDWMLIIAIIALSVLLGFAAREEHRQKAEMTHAVQRIGNQLDVLLKSAR